ncbi:MAG: hypothetical protein H6698_07405 [Myxococcales bacterium]|nr:hypothetical protein [Myxococcales bacterium]MCB9534133.1 hypothetical protein [Myxococcales bacterium]
MAPAVLLTGGWLHRWTSDDGLIFVRVARMIQAGYGPVFNPLERVEAATSALWPWWIVALDLLPGDVEWAMVFGSLALTAVALVVAQWAALRWHAAGVAGTTGLALPVGALAYAGLPVAWDFATSGLETPLSLIWLAVTWAILLAPVSGGRRSLRGWAVRAAWVGLAPLVRPDLALYGLPALLWLAGCARVQHPGRLAVLAVAAGAGALPVGWQVFRMGFYAAVVPNTALAKSAADARWDQGLRYLGDFVGTWWLAWPLLLVAAALMAGLGRAGNRGSRLAASLLPAMGALHALYIVRVGGGFMHGRMLLLPLFAILLPAMALPVLDGICRRVRVLSAVGVVAWVAWAGAAPRSALDHGHGIADERRAYITLSDTQHPVTAADHRNSRWGRDGAGIGELVAERCVDHCEPIVLDDRDLRTSQVVERGGLRAFPGQPWLGDRVGVVAARRAIGALAVLAGDRAHIVDLHGLADPIGARLPADPQGRVGHAKTLPAAWVLARFAAIERIPEDSPVAAARTALTCGGPLTDLHAAVTEPMTAQRFGKNLRLAVELRGLRVPQDPFEAAMELCP